MPGRILDIEKKNGGEIVKLGVSIDEFIIHFLVKDGKLINNGFECYAHGFHRPQKYHYQEARRVAEGFLSDFKKRQQAKEKQISLI